MRARILGLVVGLALSGLWFEPACGQGSEAVGDPVSAAAHRARGLEHGYNLDREEALAAFEDAIAADPGDPSAYRLAAATVWTRSCSSRARSASMIILDRQKRAISVNRRGPSSLRNFAVIFAGLSS